MSAPTTSSLRSAVLAQLLGAVVAFALIRLAYPKLLTLPLAAAAVQGICAALASYKLGTPKWWLPIHVCFLPAALWLAQAGIPPLWYLAAFALLLATYWRTDRSRVPLYLSNAPTARAVAVLLPPAPAACIDLGCGEGGLLRRLARARPDCRFVGVEHAPLPWLWARISCATLANVSIHYGDFWGRPLAAYDVVYAFLSPVPMPRLMEKAQAEMRPGTLLIANSFAVPGATPARIVAVDDRRGTQLYCYRVAADK